MKNFLVPNQYISILLEYFRHFSHFSQIKITQGTNYFKVFFIYLATTQKYKNVKDFIQFFKKEKKGGQDMIKILDELRSEGRMEGELKGQINIIENMLHSDLDWKSIYKITGIDNNKFEDMKIKLQQLQIAPVIADKSLSDRGATQKSCTLLI